MVKKYKSILSILLVVLICLSVVLVTGVWDKWNVNKLITDKENLTTLPDTYDDTFTTVTEIEGFDGQTYTNVPMLKTDIDNILYAMDTQGNVTFWKLGGNTVTQLAETGSFQVQVTCSAQTLTAQMHYLEYDGKTTGYGLFTNELYPGTYLYDYAFFKLSDFFPNVSAKSGTLLLMADVDKTRFYSEDKVYSEIFTLSSKHVATYYLNEDQRTLDLDAKMRTDYKMFTDDIDDQKYSKILFFSSRFYTAYDEYTKYDIMSSGGSGENVDNIRYIKDVASLNFWRSDSGTYYFRNDESGEGFNLCFYDGSNETTVHNFQGSLSDDYIIDGDYILNRESGDVYSIYKDTTETIDYSAVTKGFKPDLFEISDDGRYCVVRGSDTMNEPAVLICDFTNGTTYRYANDVFGYVSTINIATDGTILMSISSDMNGTSCYQLITKDGSSYATGETTSAQETLADGE